MLVSKIEDFCKENNLSYKRYKVNNSRDIISESESIEVLLKGSDSLNQQIVFFCSINSPTINQKFYDNSVAIKIMLNLINNCKEVSFKKNILFVFSGGNEGDVDRNLGIKFFLKDIEYLNKTLFIVLDIFNISGKIRFTGSRARSSIPLNILKPFLFLLKNESYKDFYFNRSEISRARILFQQSDSYLNEFYNNDLLALAFSNRENLLSKHSSMSEKRVENIMNFFYKFLLSIDSIQLPLDADINYLYFNFFNKDIILSEKFQVVFFITLFFLFLMLRFFFPKFQRLHPVSFFKLLPFVIVLFIIFFFLSLLPAFLLYILELLLNYFRIYANSILLYLFNIFILPLLTIFIFLDFFKKWSFPFHSYIYTYGFLTLSLFNLFISMFFDISFVLVFLLPVIFITVSHYLKQNYLIKSILHIFAFIPYVLIVYDLTHHNRDFFLENVNPFLFNFIFLIFIFPLVLLAIGIYIRFFDKFKLNKKILIASILFIALSSSLYFIYISRDVKNNFRIEAKLVTFVKDNFSFIDIKSNLFIGDCFIDYGYKKEKVKVKGKAKEIIIPSVKTPYILNMQNFNDSIYYFSITSNAKIEYIKVYLFCPKDMYPLEASYSYILLDSYDFDYFDKDIDPDFYDIYLFNIPRNIGNNFFLKLNLLPGNYKLFFRTEYPSFTDPSLNVYKNNSDVTKRSIFIEKFDL